VFLLIIVKNAHLGIILMVLLVLNVMLHVTVVLGQGLITVTSHVVIIITTLREIVKILALIIIMLMKCLKTAKVVLR